jgi:hypothetical protein
MWSINRPHGRGSGSTPGDVTPRHRTGPHRAGQFTTLTSAHVLSERHWLSRRPVLIPSVVSNPSCCLTDPSQLGGCAGRAGRVPAPECAPGRAGVGRPIAPPAEDLHLRPLRMRFGSALTQDPDAAAIGPRVAGRALFAANACAPRMPLASLFTTQEGAPVAVDPSDYFELTMSELREVARFAAQGAQEVLRVFERADPEDRRPRTAIEAAWEFANGARRSRLQRVAALDAHRAAKDAPTEAARHAAHAAGDAASAAYLHPFAKADQVGHILRADAHAARVKELLTGDRAVGLMRINRAAERATPLLVDVLRRYPPAPVGQNRVSILMKELDEKLRTH